MRQFVRSLAVRLALAVALLAVVPGLSGRAVAQDGLNVEAISFAGNKRYDEETLRLSLRTKVGQPLDRALLQEDINTLYGFFDTVELEEEQTLQGIRLRFLVTENPLVRDVVIQGLGTISEADVVKKLETSRGRPLADFRLENDARKLLRMLRDEGLHFAEVETSVTDVPDGKRVTFTVREGPKVTVDEIRFEGATSLPKEKLLENMALGEPGLLGFSADAYVKETLTLDLLTVRNYFRAEGWLDADVGLVDEQFSADRSEVTIVIAVNEGPVYQVGQVEIRGGDSYPGGAAALQELVRVQPGMRRRQVKVSETVSAIESAFREEGFFAVRVTAEEALPAEGTTVNLTFSIEEQAKVRVRKLDILGNTITRDKVIRREISLFPDGILNQNEIDKSLNRLRGTGYFQRVTAAVKDVPEGEDPTKKDVVFEVDDTARTGQVRFAAGISSDLGFVGSVSVTKRNFDWQDWPDKFGDVFTGRAFTGGGQTFALELAPGSEFSNYRLAFTEPWLFDQPVSFGWDLFFSKFQRFDYDVDRRGINLALGKRWTSTGKQTDTVVGLTGTTRLEKHDVSNIQSDSSPVAFISEGDNSLFAERLTLRLDTLDNSLEPSSGWFAQLAGEMGFGGDVQIWKTEVEGRHYWIVHRDDEEREHVFSLGARFGVTEELSGSVEADANLFDEDHVPIYERFTGGGSSSVRGFEYGGVGPHGEGDPFLLRAAERRRPRRRDRRLAQTTISTLENDGDPLGGDVVLTSSAEYSFPVYEDVLKMVVFVDAGLVRDSFDSVHGLDESRVRSLQARLRRQGRAQRRLARQIEFDDGPGFLGDLRIAAGFGVRVKIPFLGQQPIAIDFGFPVKKEEGDDTQVVSFSIARDF